MLQQIDDCAIAEISYEEFFEKLSLENNNIVEIISLYGDE